MPYDNRTIFHHMLGGLHKKITRLNDYYNHGGHSGGGTGGTTVDNTAVINILNQHTTLLQQLTKWGTEMNVTIQATLDKITALKTREEGWAVAYDLLKKTNDDNAAKVADLQSKIDAGADVTQEDIDALAAGNATLDEVLASIPDAVVANTPTPTEEPTVVGDTPVEPTVDPTV